MATDDGFYSIIEHAVDGAETQQEVIAAFAAIQERWVRFYPGYRAARFHASTDGTRVFNIVHWASEADYRHFVETSDTAGRMAAITAAMTALAGRAEARTTSSPTYRVVREIGPGPQRRDG